MANRSTPTTPAAVPPPLPQTAADMLAGITTVDVLVVDDDPDTLFLLVTCLGDAGYQVLSARDGQEALHYLSALRPGVILLDLSLPDIDGWTVLHHLQQAQVNVPVILISGAPIPQLRLRLRHPSVIAFVPKPFDLDALLARVDLTLRAAAAG